MKKRAILVVSFGTAYQETCLRTIEQIEADIRNTYPEYAFYRAWTSEVIRRKVNARDGVYISNVREALEQIRGDGVQKVCIQPTYIVDGVENEKMMGEAACAKAWFEKVTIGTPLLACEKDCVSAAHILPELQKLEPAEVCVYMGHGTEKRSDFYYQLLNEQLEIAGASNIMIGTLEGILSVEDILRKIQKRNINKVILSPFMTVAGVHAWKNMAGEQTDSWKSIFEKAGYQVECVMRGLGEYPEIRKVFLNHLKEIIE